MDIGKPRRVIVIEPVILPVPEPAPMLLREPVPERVPEPAADSRRTARAAAR